MKLLDLFYSWVDKRVRKKAVNCRTVSFTFEELVGKVENFSKELAGLDASLVGIAVGNSSYFVVANLALWKVGKVPVLIDKSLPFESQSSLAAKLGIRYVLVKGGNTSFSTVPLSLEAIDVEESPFPKETVLVKLTSGSTGLPRAVCLSENTLLSIIRSISEGMSLTEDDSAFIPVPISHSYGYDNGVLALTFLGNSLTLTDSFVPIQIINEIKKNSPSVVLLSPPLVKALANYEFSLPSVRLVISAGGHLDPKYSSQFYEKTGRYIHQLYGSTETAAISFEPRPWEKDSEGTVGFALPGVKVSMDNSGRAVVSSGSIFGAFLGEKRYKPPKEIILNDYISFTDSGRIKILGRSLEVIEVGGKKIYAPLVEEKLRSVEGVNDAACIGVEKGSGNRVLVVFLVVDKKFKRDNLPADIKNRKLIFVDFLPYSSRGKLDRSKLLEWASER